MITEMYRILRSFETRIDVWKGNSLIETSEPELTSTEINNLSARCALIVVLTIHCCGKQ